MKKIINLVRCEFIKNYTLKNIILMIVILLISVVSLVEINHFLYYSYDTSGDSIDYLEKEYKRYEEKEDLTYRDEFEKYDLGLRIKYKKMELEYNNFSGWHSSVISKLTKIQKEAFVINQILNSNFDIYFADIGNSSLEFYDEYTGLIHSVYFDDTKVLEDELEKIEKQKKVLENLLVENKYYKYLEFDISNLEYNEQELKFYKLLIEQKIEDDKDYRVLNFKQYCDIPSSNDYLSLEDFYNYDLGYSYSSYEGYVRMQKSLGNEYERKTAILKYAIENNKKHDLTFSERFDSITRYDKYITSKISTNLILCMSVVVMIILILTSSGIVSSEHSKGTDKLLLTSPVKRWKVLFSKFIYLIMHSYVIFGLALILIALYSGMKYGFNDLFTSKLFYQNGNVIEVNYFLYLLKDIFKCSIPIIAFISIMLCLSTISLSTSLTIGLSMIISIVSLFMWHIIIKLKAVFLAFIPITYFSYGFVILNPNYETYIEALSYADVGYDMCLVVSLVTIFVFYFIANLIYVKRDIKN